MTTSSDSVLTATADPGGLGVALTVDFSAVVPAGTINRIPNASNDAGSLLLAGASSAVTQSATFARTGSNSSRITRSTGSGTAIGQTPSGTGGFPVSGGETVVGSCYVRSTAARTVTLGVAFYTAAGASVGSTTTGTGVTTTTTGFTARPVVSATAPATAVYAQLIVTVASVASTSEFHYADDFQLERGSAASAFAFGTQSDAVFIGAANASMSVRPAYNKVTVTRGGVAVRGLDSALAPGGQARGFDAELPRAALTTYQASISNGYGTVSSATATETLPFPAGGLAVLASLYTPALSAQVIVAQMPEWQSDRPVGVLYPVDAEFPLTSEGARRGWVGELLLRTSSDAQRLALANLLKSDGPYLLQTPSSWGEGDLYMTVTSVTYSRIVRYAPETRRVARLSVILVSRPPTTGSTVAIPGHTYADSLVAWPLYSNRTGTYGAR